MKSPKCNPFEDFEIDKREMCDSTRENLPAHEATIMR